MSLLTLEEAQERLLSLAPPLGEEELPVTDAVGRWLAADLMARIDRPAADLSAMDGYAVRSGDATGPWTVIGESAAGHPFAGDVGPGEAVRISTGAVLPRAAGSVIVQEDTDREEDRLVLTGDGPSPPDKHIRRARSDFAADAVVLAQGARLGAAQLGLALSAGCERARFGIMPKVALFDSGDELGEGAAGEAHRIPASNAAMLGAMLAPIGCPVLQAGAVPDDLDAINAALARAEAADIIVTSGGASVGDHDLVKPALEAWGARIAFWRVAIKPGKPLLVATRERSAGGMQIILGLPGNPVSAYVTALLFLVPLAKHMAGAAHPLPRTIAARLAAPCPANGSRRTFLRAHWDGERVETAASQDSAGLATLARCDALIDRPANAPAAADGELVSIFPLENGGIA